MKKLLLPFLILAVAALGEYAIHIHSIANDSSSNGSEIREVLESSVPADVTTKVIEERSASTSSRDVAGVQTYRVPVLMYHYIEYIKDKNDKTRISLNTTPYTLENEIKTLSDAGYTFLQARELSDVMNGTRPLPEKPIVLTFDDGYRDFYTDAYPILQKYHAKATQYIITGFLGWQNHMTASQVKKIAADGLVEIGAHTVHHAYLKGMKLTQATMEMFQSKVYLENLTGQSVVSFAYPFGAFDQQAWELARNIGFTNVVSTIPGVDQSKDNRFFLYRLRPGGRTGQQLLSWLTAQENSRMTVK